MVGAHVGIALPLQCYSYKMFSCLLLLLLSRALVCDHAMFSKDV